MTVGLLDLQDVLEPLGLTAVMVSLHLYIFVFWIKLLHKCKFELLGCTDEMTMLCSGAPGSAGRDGLTGATGPGGRTGGTGAIGPAGPSGPRGDTGKFLRIATSALDILLQWLRFVLCLWCII